MRSTRPILTIARDVERKDDLPVIIDQAQELNLYCEKVIIVPKDKRLRDLEELIPERFLLGYSVPTRYGGTAIPLSQFGRRPVHLLGGRPDVQYELSRSLTVWSFDGNRVTLDAQYGDFFDGTKFRAHPKGGYYECIRDSLKGIDKLWLTHRHSAIPKLCQHR